MSKIGAAFLTGALLVSTPVASMAAPAADTLRHISRDAAWGCRDKNDVINLLFLGLSASYDTQLASALADGRCVSFKQGEDVTILDGADHGLVRVQRGGAEQPVVYWTALRNLD
jgi:hypothetical protein